MRTLFSFGMAAFVCVLLLASSASEGEAMIHKKKGGKAKLQPCIATSRQACNKTAGKECSGKSGFEKNLCMKTSRQACLETAKATCEKKAG